MDNLKEEKLNAKIDKILDRNINYEFNPEEIEMLKTKLQKNKKKNLRELILNHRQHPSFKNAFYLKYVYDEYIF